MIYRFSWCWLQYRPLDNRVSKRLNSMTYARMYRYMLFFYCSTLYLHGVHAWMRSFKYMNSCSSTSVLSATMYECTSCFEAFNFFYMVFEFAHAFVTLCFLVTDVIKNILNLDLICKHSDSKALISPSIRHRSDTLMSDRCLIDVELRVFVI